MLLRYLSLIAGCGICVQSQGAFSNSSSSAVFYVNSTTYSPFLPFYPAASRNAELAVDTLFPSTNLSSQIINLFASQLNSTSSPGGALLISTPQNGTLFQSFGFQGLNDSQPFRLDNHLRIASNTKTFTASSILKLVSEGRLLLNDTISKFYNGSSGTIPYGNNITIREMLSMSSGIFEFGLTPQYVNGPNIDPTSSIPESTLLNYTLRETPYFPPGQTAFFNYSNTNYLLLGLVVEQLSGMPIGTYIRNNFITPLNLSETSYPVDTLTLPAPHPTGYAFYPPNATSGIRDATLYNPNNPGAAGAMISTLQDMRKWVEAMVRGYGYSATLSQQRLYGLPNLPPGPLPAGINITYGLGDIQLNGYYGHDGGIKGFGTIMFTNPVTNVTICGVGTLGADVGQGGISLTAAYEIIRLLQPYTG